MSVLYPNADEVRATGSFLVNGGMQASVVAQRSLFLRTAGALHIDPLALDASRWEAAIILGGSLKDAGAPVGLQVVGELEQGILTAIPAPLRWATRLQLFLVMPDTGG